MHQSIAARAANARPNAPEITSASPIDRTGCPGTGKHGTNGAARTRGCTCPDAIAARTAYDQQRYRARKPNGRQLAVGTRRRLRMLAALNVTTAEMAAATGLHQDTIRGLIAGAPGHAYVYNPTATAVRNLFERVVARLDELAASPTRGRHGLTAVAAGDRHHPDTVAPARAARANRGQQATIANSGEPRQRSA